MMKTEELAAALLDDLKQKNRKLATAESCTGGSIGQVLTAIPGSSAAYLGGVISYANEIKENVLKVPGEILRQYGAVSEQTAAAMVRGVKELFCADAAVSVTGIAGPASDDTKKPVGLVYIGVAAGETVTVKENHFSGTREEIRQQSVQTALTLLLEALGVQ